MTEAQTRVSRLFAYGSKEDLMPYNAMVGVGSKVCLEGGD